MLFDHMIRMRDTAKLQITIDETVMRIIEREATLRKTRPTTYAAMIFSECVLMREKNGW